jgi:hypothetical protein
MTKPSKEESEEDEEEYYDSMEYGDEFNDEEEKGYKQERMEAGAGKKKGILKRP